MLPSVLIKVIKLYFFYSFRKCLNLMVTGKRNCRQFYMYIRLKINQKIILFIKINQSNVFIYVCIKNMYSHSIMFNMIK